jgi:ribosomal protein L12E/L44/L45/RPP1/RPP2
MKQEDLRDVFKEASTNIYTLSAAAFAELLSPTPSDFSWTQETTEEEEEKEEDDGL